MTTERIKAEIIGFRAVIQSAETRIKELQSLCFHEFEDCTYSPRTGQYFAAKVCKHCGYITDVDTTKPVLTKEQ